MNRTNEKVKVFSIKEILWRSFRLGLKVKTPTSLLISILAIPAALFPLFLSRQLQRITDILVNISKTSEISLAVVITSLVLLGLLFLLQQISLFITEYYNISDRYRTRLYIKEYVLNQVCNVHYSYIENRDDFIKRIEFADTYIVNVMGKNIQSIFLILQQLVTFVSISVALWAVHPLLVLIVVITSIPAAFLAYKQSDDTFRHRAKWSEEGHLAIFYYHLCSSYTKGMQEVRHYELYDYLKARWRALADSHIDKKNQLTTKHLKVNLLSDLFRSGIYLIILTLTAWEIYQNPLLGVGTFTLVYTLSDKLQKSTGYILTQIMEFATSLEYLQEFFSLEKLDREENDISIETPTAIEDSKGGSISFQNVSFSYPGTDKEVLHNISVSVKAGEKIAIVGDNGSGKSTFISLLAGLFVPRSGVIEVDGMNVNDHKQHIRDKISVVFQDFAHYDGTLRENITVSDASQDLSDEELMKLAKKARVEEVIEEQPEGLNTLLGKLSPKGNDLSGGQWQKIALLRALHRNKTNIMILDEPTAALDPLAEAELYRNFSQITGDRTTLLISHRLGITKLVDRILVFHDGRIIEEGSHQELMNKEGHYYKMYKAQASWYQNEEGE